MFKHETSPGPWMDATVKDNNTLILDGKHVTVYGHRKPEEVPWPEAGVDYVVDATGVFTGKDEAAAHLKGTVKKVVICSASSDAPMFVVGVNEKTYTSDLDVVSAATSATNGLAPLVKVIDDRFGIVQGFATTVRSTPVTQKTVWMPATGAIATFTSMSPKDVMAFSHVLPHVGANLAWNDHRVPTTKASMVELTVELKNFTTYDEIKRVVKEESEGQLKGILGFADEGVVLTDLVGNSRSCIFDAREGKALGSGKLVRLVAWQDEHWAYANRVVDLIKHMANTDHKD